jgi:lysophospholipase L1-like esterase
VMQNYLLQRFGSSKVAVFGSCGSSPEHWIRSGPTFITKCGYRELTPSSSINYDFKRGRRPQHSLTPKLEDLVSKFRPRIVIVQLGTNWMDSLRGESQNQKGRYDQILDQFVAAIRSAPDSSRQIIWISPPDSSHYSHAIQRTVNELIKSAALRDSFEMIDSSRLTHYIPGKSGADGIHYNSEAAKDWADRVISELNHRLR